MKTRTFKMTDIIRPCSIVQEAEMIMKPNPAIMHNPSITSSQEGYKFFKQIFDPNKLACQEYFYAVYMNRNNRVLGYAEISKGSVCGTVVCVQTIIAQALMFRASAVTVCHNHPSGNTNPSDKDRTLTAKLKDACKLMDLVLLDSMIITPYDEYYSFSDMGHMY